MLRDERDKADQPYSVHGAVECSRTWVSDNTLLHEAPEDGHRPGLNPDVWRTKRHGSTTCVRVLCRQIKFPLFLYLPCSVSLFVAPNEGRVLRSSSNPIKKGCVNSATVVGIEEGHDV